jgi:hypothetical protein
LQTIVTKLVKGTNCAQGIALAGVLKEPHQARGCLALPRELSECQTCRPTVGRRESDRESEDQSAGDPDPDVDDDAGRNPGRNPGRDPGRDPDGKRVGCRATVE